jgi:hypothetical protein
MGTTAFVVLLSLCGVLQTTIGLTIIAAGGTGRLGKILIPKLLNVDLADGGKNQATVLILTRNSYLASTPSRVSHDYGHLGQGFIEQYNRKNLKLRDWDGGDLLDIVGQDWMGWQKDVLPQANVILHLTGGGFTEQRVMACERLVRESLKYNPIAHHVTVNPSKELLAAMSPGLNSVKTGRIERCEAMVRENCRNYTCLRIEQRDPQVVCQRILDTLDDIVFRKR